MKIYWNTYIQKAFWTFVFIAFLRKDLLVIIFVLILGLIQLIMTMVHKFKGETDKPDFPDDRNSYLDKFIRLDEKHKKIANLLLYITCICFFLLCLNLTVTYYEIINWAIFMSMLTRIFLSIKLNKKKRIV